MIRCLGEGLFGQVYENFMIRCVQEKGYVSTIMIFFFLIHLVHIPKNI